MAVGAALLRGFVCVRVRVCVQVVLNGQGGSKFVKSRHLCTFVGSLSSPVTFTRMLCQFAIVHGMQRHVKSVRRRWTLCSGTHSAFKLVFLTGRACHLGSELVTKRVSNNSTAFAAT